MIALSNEALGKALREAMQKCSGTSENVYGPGVFSINMHKGHNEKLRMVLREAMK